MEQIVNNYMKYFENKNTCFCSDQVELNIKSEHLELFFKNDNNPEILFLISSYFYKEENYDKSLEYINKAIQKGYNKSNNRLAGICYNTGEKEQALEFYLKGIENKEIRTYFNINFIYLNDKNDKETTKKYLLLGIEENVNCCKYYYYQLFEKEPVNIVKITECANNGCYRAIKFLYNDTTEMKDKIKIMKLGEKFGAVIFVIKLIDYYENKNIIKFNNLLQKYENSQHGEILFHISKKYAKLNHMDKMYKCLFDSIKLGYKEAFNYLININTLINENVNDERKKIVLEYMKKNDKEDDYMKLNMLMILCHLGDENEIKKIIEEESDQYWKNILHYRYLQYNNKYEESYEYLINAYSLDPEQKRLGIYFNLGFMHKKSDPSLEKKIYKQGIKKHDDSNCKLILAGYYGVATSNIFWLISL